MAIQNDGTVHALFYVYGASVSYANNRPETRQSHGFSKPLDLAIGPGVFPGDIAVAADGTIAVAYMMKQPGSAGLFIDILVRLYRRGEGWSGPLTVTEGFTRLVNRPPLVRQVPQTGLRPPTSLKEKNS